MVTKGVAVSLDELRKEMRKAKENEKPNRTPTFREAVAILLPEILALRRDRWSDTQISEWLGKRGFNITPGTLAQYVREAKSKASATAHATEPGTETDSPTRTRTKRSTIEKTDTAASDTQDGKPNDNAALDATTTDTAAVQSPDVKPSARARAAPGTAHKKIMNDEG